MKAEPFHGLTKGAARRCGANGGGTPGAWSIAALAAGLVALSGCAGVLGGVPEAAGVHVVSAPAPSETERYCAWYGAPGGDGVLYFGQAAFWSAMRAAGGDPRGDLLEPGPQLVGRFDLAREALLEPLAVDAVNADPALPGGAARSGVWDVHPGPGGEVFFTTFFEDAGAVDPQSGRVRALRLGGALNEIAAGPDGALLVTRYGSGSADGGSGGVLAFAPAGHVLREWSLPAPPGYRVAPKTPAWDPVTGELHVTTDLLPRDDAGDLPVRHDTYVLGPAGDVRDRIAEPEVQFVTRGPDGSIYAAEVSGDALALRVVPRRGGRTRRVPLDASFPTGLDFVQDIQPAADGRVVLTRWSGRVHVLHPDGRVGTLQLPRLDPDGLYYTGVLHGERLCATYCADVTVVCADAP